MLLPAQVIPFLTNENALLRETAVRYFKHAQDVGPLTAEQCWAAIHSVGLGRGVTGLILLLPDLPQSDASTEALLAALDLPADESMREWLIQALDAIDFSELRRYADPIFARTDLPEDTREHLQARLDLADVPAQAVWDQLQRHADDVSELYWDEFDHRIADRLIEALARFGQDSTDRAISLIRRLGGQGDLLEIFAINLLARMRHRPALDLLLRALVDWDAEDDDLHEALQDAIPQIAGVDAVAPLEARIPAQSWSFALTAAEILSRIKHPDAEGALLRLIDHPKLIESRDALADALFSLCTTDGLARLRQIVIEGAYDAQSYDLKDDLVACALMAGFDFPELSVLREEVVAKRVETQRRLEAGEFDLSGFDEMDDDLSEADFDDDPDDLPDLPASLDDRAPRHTAPIHNRQAKIGRNDPCPCGSGKKYKKCCIDKQADA